MSTSGNYVALTEKYVDFSDLYVDLSENDVDLSEIKLTSRWQLKSSTRYKNKICIATICDDFF